MVAAAVVDPDNQIVARLNRPGQDGKRIHAEHAAMLDYTDKYGPIPEGSIVITTLSPCNEAMDERDGPSCTELINNSTVKKVYCGYIDPTQDDDTRQFNLMETADRELRNKCKQFADTFLDDVDETQTLDERRKKKRRVRHAAYGPGLFGGYGYYAGYSGDSSGDGGGAGGGESIKNEDAMMGKLEDGGKIIRILKKAHTVPFSDEKNWLLVDVDPAKGNKGLGLKWIPADTRFEWVRPYRDSVDENFADGKNPQDKGDSKRHGINTKASVSSLRKTAKQGGRKGQLAHWLANMKSGRQK
jgi:pyrimidine deaminase RibD-like protein